MKVNPVRHRATSACITLSQLSLFRNYHGPLNVALWLTCHMENDKQRVIFTPDVPTFGDGNRFVDVRLMAPGMSTFSHTYSGMEGNEYHYILIVRGIKNCQLLVHSLCRTMSWASDGESWKIRLHAGCCHHYWRVMSWFRPLGKNLLRWENIQYWVLDVASQTPTLSYHAITFYLTPNHIIFLGRTITQSE
jgi:hypothetical protein